MARNRFFSERVRSEQRLYEDIIIESLKIYGQDVYYLPREIVNENKIFGEDVPSRFSTAYKIEMYIENTEGFDGEGDLFTKFGVEIRDQATFIVARRRWTYIIGDPQNDIEGERPLEGDLIYLPLSNSMFQIMHVEHQQPFYQINNLPTYKLQCELFEYNDEDFDTSINQIDDIEKLGYTVALHLMPNWDSDNADWAPNFTPGREIEQVLASGKKVHGEVVSYNRTTHIVEVAHVGGDSGEYVMFEPGPLDIILPPYTEGFDGVEESQTQQETRIIKAVYESLSSTGTEQNDEFNAASDNYLLDFLDFSEANPFGDPDDEVDNSSNPFS